VDIWTYFSQREKEFEEFSLAPDPPDAMFAEEHGSNGRRGKVFGHAHLSDNAYLEIHEEVVIVDESHVHREEYGYFLIIDGVEMWGYERDPSHDPPVHRHTYGHSERIDADPISFKDAVELAWQEVSRRETLR
jgi:hypothetical protein